MIWENVCVFRPPDTHARTDARSGGSTGGRDPDLADEDVAFFYILFPKHRRYVIGMQIELYAV